MLNWPFGYWLVLIVLGWLILPLWGWAYLLLDRRAAWTS